MLSLQAMNDHTDLVDDQQRLWSAYAESGYLYLRDVIDLDAVAEVRDAYLAVLTDLGLVELGDLDAHWTGADLDVLDPDMLTLFDQRVWQKFVERPTVNAFFERLFGEPVTYLPAADYRVTAPSAVEPSDPFVGRHQDGFYNEGIAFRVCWIPLVTMDVSVGGLAVTEGCHQAGYLHDLDNPPRFQIPKNAVPDDVWRHPGTYHPGDLVVFDTYAPHSGLANRSDRFRLSLDLRVLGASERQPVCGKVIEISPDSVVIEDVAGRHRLALTSESYLRGHRGARFSQDEAPDLFPPDSKVMASHVDGSAVLVRLVR